MPEQTPEEFAGVVLDSWSEGSHYSAAIGRLVDEAGLTRSEALQFLALMALNSIANALNVVAMRAQESVELQERWSKMMDVIERDLEEDEEWRPDG